MGTRREGEKKWEVRKESEGKEKGERERGGEEE